MKRRAEEDKMRKDGGSEYLRSGTISLRILEVECTECFLWRGDGAFMDVNRRIGCYHANMS